MENNFQRKKLWFIICSCWWQKGSRKSLAHIFSSPQFLCFFSLLSSESFCLSLLQKKSGNWMGILSGVWLSPGYWWGRLEGGELSAASWWRGSAARMHKQSFWWILGWVLTQLWPSLPFWNYLAPMYTLRFWLLNAQPKANPLIPKLASVLFFLN